MKKIITFSSGVLLMGFLLFACSSKEASISAPAPKEEVTVKEGWEAKWNSTIEAARKEGSVVIWGGSTVQALIDYVRFFKERFGVSLELTSGRGSDLWSRLMTQRKAGVYTQDIIISGAGDLPALKAAGVFDPLEPALLLPEVADQKQWIDGKFSWSDIEGRYLLLYAYYPGHMVAINTGLVKDGEVRSYYDLLDPKWKEKILINDPTIAGMSSVGFSNMLYHKLVDMDFMNRLVAQKPVILRDQELQLNWVALGKYSILLWPSTGRLSKFLEAKAPIGLIEDLKEGTYITSTGSTLGLVNRAPHPNAARVFINWFLSREGQAINQKNVEKQTARVDVSPEGLFPFEMRKPGVKYFPDGNDKEEWLLQERDKYIKIANQVFAPLLK